MEDVKVTSCVDEEGALSINMEGPNMGILIGKRGQTLDSPPVSDKQGSQ